jgi:hypothetical protein
MLLTRKSVGGVKISEMRGEGVGAGTGESSRKAAKTAKGRRKVKE